MAERSGILRFGYKEVGASERDPAGQRRKASMALGGAAAGIELFEIGVTEEGVPIADHSRGRGILLPQRPGIGVMASAEDKPLPVSMG